MKHLSTRASSSTTRIKTTFPVLVALQPIEVLEHRPAQQGLRLIAHQPFAHLSYVLEHRPAQQGLRLPRPRSMQPTA